LFCWAAARLRIYTKEGGKSSGYGCAWYRKLSATRKISVGFARKPENSGVGGLFFFDRCGFDPYHCALMSQPPFSQPLPRQGDPRKYAQQGIEISGFVDLKQLPRLTSAVADENARFAVVLSFKIDEERKRVVQGSIEGEVGLTCQRCLDTVRVPLVCAVNLGIVWDEEQAKTLPRDRDPWIAEEGPAEFYDVVEEELLLSLPPVAYHDHACVPSEHFVSKAPETGAQEQPKQNPFQVLEQLKGTPKK
jgi:uncharacterized protein